MPNITPIIIQNIFWVDVIAFTLLGLLILFIWLANHIVLQLFTAIFLIHVGAFLLAFPFIKPFVVLAKNWIVARIDEPIAKTLVLFFAQNSLFVEVLFFVLLFFVCLIFTAFIYLAFIKFQYHFSFSLISFRQNIWKIFYLPFLVLGIGFITALVIPIIGEKLSRKSYFINLLYQTRLNKIIERKNGKVLAKTINKVTKHFKVLVNEHAPPLEKKKSLLNILTMSLTIAGIDPTQNSLWQELKPVEKNLSKKLLNLDLTEKERDEASAQLVETLNERPDMKKQLDDLVIDNKQFINQATQISTDLEKSDKSIVGLLDVVAKNKNISPSLKDFLTNSFD